MGDCTVRAISKATGKEWGETYLAMAVQGYLDGDMPSANAVWGAYLRRHGLHLLLPKLGKVVLHWLRVIRVEIRVKCHSYASLSFCQ